MALKLIATYSKRLGLPGYSSHQFSVCVETEITSIDEVAGQSARLYATLQTSVDEQIQLTGFVPDAAYGMDKRPQPPSHQGSQESHTNGSDHEQLAHSTDTQTTAYALLYRESTGHKETGIELHSLVKTKSPKLVVTHVPPADEGRISRLFRLIESHVSGVQRGDFVPSPGLGCSTCEFFNECRAWTGKRGAA